MGAPWTEDSLAMFDGTLGRADPTRNTQGGDR
jgi:hypothetical protein